MGCSCFCQEDEINTNIKKNDATKCNKIISKKSNNKENNTEKNKTDKNKINKNNIEKNKIDINDKKKNLY